VWNFGAPSVLAFDVTDRFSIGGVLAGAYQHQELSDVAPPDDSLGRGAVVFQPEFSFLLTEKDELFAAFGFAAGNALNDQTPFSVSPWAANLEADVKSINGRDRDYLLEGWYKHTFDLGPGNRLALTGGIIDAAGFLDENAYANDEQTQFMNSALVNGPHVFLPSYDLGGAVEWESGPFSAKGVYMNVGENDPATGDNNYNFYGVQAGYRLDTDLGEGNYRVVVDGTSEDFLDPSGAKRESLLAVLFSFDQQLGEHFGAWVRFGWQDDEAAVTHTGIYSGGLQINGTTFGRPDDAIGIGVAYMPGATQAGQPIDNTQVAELYWRIALHQYFALTLDAQYIADDYRDGFGDGPNGYLLSARAVVEF
jgi:porin